MIPQTQTSIPPGLQALMVLKQQAAPTTPQGTPTIAAQTAQQAEQSQMPPTSPQGGIADVAKNTATGNAIEMQQQQEAQKRLMDQMLAQQQQPPMMAEGGIASLYTGNMDDFAEGGVVGFAEGGQPKRAIERLWDWLQSVDEESQKARWKSAAPQETQQPMVPMIPNKGLEEPAATNLSVLPSAGYNFPSSVLQAASSKAEQKPVATGIASGRGSNIPSITQLINESTLPLTAALAGYTAPDKRTPQQIEELDLAELRRKGLPEKEKAAEEQGLAELRRNNEAIREFQRQMLAKRETALGTPGEQSMNRFMEALRYGGQGKQGGFAQGLQNAILAERQGAEARDAERLKMLETGKAEAIEYTRIQALIDDARRARALGRVDEAQKLEEAAREAANKIVMTRAEGAKGAIPSAISAYGGMRQQQMQDARAERAESRGSEFERLYQKLFPNQPMTLENVEAVKRALSPGLEDRAAAAKAANDIKRKALLDKNMAYKLLSIDLMATKDPVVRSQIEDQMASIERKEGIIESGAATGAPALPAGVTVKRVGQ